jgi:hypothetical protein
MEKFRGLALKRMSYELQDPACDEKTPRHNPEAVVKKSSKENGQRNQNRGNAEGMAKPVNRVLMAAPVPRNPLLTAVRPQHGA